VEAIPADCSVPKPAAASDTWRKIAISSIKAGLIDLSCIAEPEFLPTLCNLNAFASSDVVGFGVSWVESAIFERA
jgi:hypothetical protein